MTSLATHPISPALADEQTIRAVDLRLDELFAAQRDEWSRLPHGDSLVDELSAVIAAGGKRLRPRFCHWGYVGATGEPPNDDVIDVAAALELLHAFALIHDDIMDGSSTRRGAPSAHAVQARRHLREQWGGDRRRFAEGTALLLGDLAYSLAHRLVSGLPPRARPVWQRMCSELVLGQYLDLRGAVAGERSASYATATATLKAARYTVVRPLQLGAAAAGDCAPLNDAYLAYGDAVGRAFQYRDDLLGVFGDPDRTGKPVGEDLREGKPTLLLSLTCERAPKAAMPLLARVGQPDLSASEMAMITGLCESTGARDELLVRIDAAVELAAEAITSPAVNHAAVPGLVSMARAAARRDR